MNIRQLRQLLKTAETHYRADGNREIANALSDFVENLLIGKESAKVSTLVSQIETARKPEKAPSPRARRGKR